MMIGGAEENALTFSESNTLFSFLSTVKESEDCSKAMLQLQIDHDSWTDKRNILQDWAGDQLQCQSHAEHSFIDAETL